MYCSVTVDQAIRRGKQLITYPMIVIAIAGIVLTMMLGITGVISWVFMLIGMLLSILVSLVYWSFMITRWRLWAFDNVRNVHELKSRAISNNLIWPDNSFFSKAEIRTSFQKSKWLSLQERFRSVDVFQEDFTIPSETVVYYSKKKAITVILTSIVAIVVTFLFMQKSQKLVLGCTQLY